MDSINYVFLISAALMFAGIVLGASSSRFGVPFLLVFLVVGMLTGVGGPGGIQFDDYYSGFMIGNLALAIILLDGGLRTKISTFRVALKPSLVLATFGVVATAGSLALFAMWILDLDWRVALLLGVIVGSTDAAAVFSLLRSSGTRLNDRLSNTLEIESGINDPMAIFLTILLIEMLTSELELSILHLFVQLVQQFGIGAAFGVGFGWVLSEVFKRTHVGEGLHALLLCSGGVIVFALTNLAGGSGFLAIYLVGLVVGNYRYRVGENVFRAMDGFAWLGQSGMFLLLGLLVTPDEMLEVLVPSMLIALFLMLVARPLAVWIGLLPFRFSARETAFVAWVGLRGAVPIVMAIFPLLAGVEDAFLIFNVAFMVVLMSLVLQGTSIPWVAKWLNVSLPPKSEPMARIPLQGVSQNRFELVQFQIPDHAYAIGNNIENITLPDDCHITNIARDGELLKPEIVNTLEKGDIVSIVAPETAIDQLASIFHAQDEAVKAEHEFYGDFMLDGTALLQDIAALYGDPELDQALLHLTLDQAIRRKLRKYAAEGDSVPLCGLWFTVHSVNSGRVTKAGIKFPEKSEN